MICSGWFQILTNMRVCQMDDIFFILNLGNKTFQIDYHFSLILCHFWRQNCLKTWILAFWTTLVNSCWPHVRDMTKYILGACKYLSQVPSPQISCPEMQNSSWGGGRKKHFLSLHPVDGLTTFINIVFFLRHPQSVAVVIVLIAFSIIAYIVRTYSRVTGSQPFAHILARGNKPIF